MAGLSPRLYRQVATLSRDRYEYCGLPQEAEVMDLTVDHVVPRAETRCLLATFTVDHAIDEADNNIARRSRKSENQRTKSERNTTPEIRTATCRD